MAKRNIQENATYTKGDGWPKACKKTLGPNDSESKSKPEGGRGTKGKKKTGRGELVLTNLGDDTANESQKGPRCLS